MDKRDKLEKFGLYDRRFEHDSCGVGFVCDIKGSQSNQIIKQGLEVLRRLAHRGATGADPKTGDGAGILIQIPQEFLAKACQKDKIALPQLGQYGTGLVFLPQDAKEREFCLGLFSRMIKAEGLVLLGWRKVPTDNTDIGPAARHTQPLIEQVFIARNKQIKEELAFERTLYVIRKKIENTVRNSDIKQKSFFYITNLSCRTLSYKGLLMPEQVENFFLDLKDPGLKSALCLVHSRYSTNTFPTWDLSQPFRFLAHNGEINTLRGNINWMTARAGQLASSAFGQELKDIFPVIVPAGSDSATLDNVFEFLVLSGRPLAHAMSMLIPAAWQRDKLLDEKIKDFYQYHACFMEPWDGPAAIAFTDGLSIGAVLDRNGLRPARFILTKDNLALMASEVGVLDIPAEKILFSGRLEPGKMLYIDTQKGKIIDDHELKQSLAEQKPYARWLKENLLEFDNLPSPNLSPNTYHPTPNKDILLQLKAFGFSREDLKTLLKPMLENGQEPVGAMGNDTPHAVLSLKNHLLYTYFKQLFAQVTNPAIDSIREELVMSLDTYLGSEKNILEETPQHCAKIKAKSPIFSNEDLAKIKHIRLNGYKTKVIPVLFKAGDEKDFLRTLDKVCQQAEEAIREGYSFLILSDRGVNAEFAALPMLLAVAGVHHHLVKNALRTQISIILESAEPREVHHFALLFGYGADCVNPYLIEDIIKYLVEQKELVLDFSAALRNYFKAIEKGILKILSKMGISTLQSYRGAQIFECLGLKDEVIQRCFCGTVSRIGGAGFDVLAKEAISRHNDAWPKDGLELPLASGGLYQWKRDGEFHLWNPETIASLQEAVWDNDFKKFQEFSCLINDQSGSPTTLRGLLKFKKAKPIALENVQPIKEIVRRFATGAMSFGSISKETHETIATAMNRLHGKSNTGEGGEDPSRFIPLPNGDSLRSAIKQVASGRFGVTTNYLINADEIQIKIAQGAKPGEGGQLPGHKVSVTIARTRYTTPGVTLISPPPHHDIYSIEDLAQLIFDLKNTNPQARISVKLVSEIGVGTIAAGVAKGHADMILISGGDGGTGASPLSSIKHAGLPWELGLSETHQTLVLNDLRGRVRLQADGQMRTGRDVAIAALLGAEEFGFCTAVLITLGCVMLRHCNLNNCSVGVATQDEILRKRFHGRSEYVVNYFHFVAKELRQIMAELGLKNLDEMVGRTDLLEVNQEILPWKAKEIDFSRILYKPKVDKKIAQYWQIKQDHGIEQVLDRKLIELAKPALEKGKPVKLDLAIRNINRATGAMLSGRVCQAYAEQGLPEDTIYCKFKGVAGQSFGAWLAKGITFELEGMANDYVGKGISGGKIIIYPDRKTDFLPQENIIIGNTTFYGAINGQAYILGLAGERFAIRNSGLYAVVEGVGDHACEYMTGGRVVILGRTGRNFGAGMSGGIAYVYNPQNDFSNKCNLEMVELSVLGQADENTVQELTHNHFRYTQSRIAKSILDDFGNQIKYFVKVMPLEYKRILEASRPKSAELDQDLEG